MNSQRDNCKLRWIFLNGNNTDQIVANMSVVHSILDNDVVLGRKVQETAVELAFAA